MDFLKANYHAHTWRCQHAYDTEREYIEAAISMGIEIFGFSDHVPCPYQDGYVSNIRMTMKQAPEYVETIRRLEAEYRDQIKIYADALVSDPQAVRRGRLTFRDSVTTGTPLVARLASEEGILCTVISASTQKLSEEVYGSMLLGIPSGQFQRAMDYIGTMSNIRVEEVDGHVQ